MGSVTKATFWFEDLLTRLGFGMRAKLILLFVFIKVVPLILIALVAWQQATQLGEDMQTRTREITHKAVDQLNSLGKIAVDDAVKALDYRATNDIERLTTDVALRVADFLYSRDDDVRYVATLPPEKDLYANFIQSHQGHLVKLSEYTLSEDGKAWILKTPKPQQNINTSSLEENDVQFRYRPPEQFTYYEKPLYHEISFIDTKGMEKLKVVTSDLMDPALKDISDPKNTFVKAEKYWTELQKLKPGEIYVSDVIGAYVGTNIIGMYTPDNAASKKVEYKPEEAAFSGTENPIGKKFKGIVRWATPVVRDNKIIGYVTLALNHDHIMNLVDHVKPTEERYSELSDGHTGNYTFIWDHLGRSIVHPRHHSIIGYDPNTGKQVEPWLPKDMYDTWKSSGLEYEEFIKDYPIFHEQSRQVKPSIELIKQERVGLDCRYLNFAPQCVGWFDLAKDGGSGSFLILWTGLWKLNTAAAIPYYTGQYGKKKVGFGFIAMGANVDDFHAPALETQKTIQSLVETTDEELSEASKQTFASIAQNLWDTAMSLSISTLVMTLLVIFIAIWMASNITQKITYLISGISKFRAGQRHFRFNAPIKDEMGVLADSFDDLANSIVASVQGPLTITDFEGSVIYMNEMSLELLGKTLNEVIGKKYTDISLFSEINSPILAFENNEEQSIIFHPPSQKYYKGKAAYLTDKDQNTIGYIIIPEDVTALITEQDRIERERALLDTVISSSPDLIWYQNTQGEYLSVNPRFAALFGRLPEYVQGKKASELLPQAVYESMNSNDEDAIQYGGPLHTEERITFADGHEEILDVVRTPLFASTGQLRGLLGVARDVTQRVSVEDELRQTQKELITAVTDANKASASKSEFLARMSHEIRTPMNAIIGMTNITKRKLHEDTGTSKELLPNILQIESSSMHLLGLLNDILDISKIEAGKIELNEESFDMLKIVDDVASIIRPRCESKNIHFEVTSHGFEKSRFISDALRIRQVLINLLGNAVKFTPELGTISFSVEAKKRENGKAQIFFSVKDTGIGIPEKMLNVLFVPFEQGGGHITRNYGGTGLGLSISRNIAMLLGSDISVHSEENKGSEFFFELWITEDIAYVDKSDTLSESIIPKGCNVLLVDDVDINRMIAMELLAPFELNIEEADDGTEAVKCFEKSEEGYYDLILMDIQMPKMNGYDASRNIRELKRSDAKGIPIVAMTANAFQDDIDMAFASGMNAHVAKPIDMEKLTDVLKMFLDNKKQTY